MRLARLACSYYAYLAAYIAHVFALQLEAYLAMYMATYSEALA